MAAILSSRADPFELFGRGSAKEHFCEIILKSGLWPRRRCRFKACSFLAVATILFSGAKRF